MSILWRVKYYWTVKTEKKNNLISSYVIWELGDYIICYLKLMYYG